MANALVNTSLILAETLRVMHNNSAFLGKVDNQYSDEFGKAGKKAGSTIEVRRPVQHRIRSGATAVVQDINETKVAITLDPEFGIDFEFTDYDMTVNTDRFKERYIKPAGIRLAAEVDQRLAALYKKVANFTGTPGTTPATQLAALLAGVKLDDNSCLRDGQRCLSLTPLANANMVDGMKALFNGATTLEEQYKTGLLKTSLGMDFQMSQNLPTHTVGAHGGTPLVNGAAQGTASVSSVDNPYAATTSLATDGWTNSVTGVLKAGDVITIAGVNAVNPETKQNTGALRDFVVTADANSGATTGPATLILSPALISGGAYQNVSALPADNAAIVVRTGTASTAYNQNVLFHRDAFTLVTVDMEVPGGMDMADKMVYEGISLRFVRGFDITNNKRISRFDILAGMAALRPEWACRLTQ